MDISCDMTVLKRQEDGVRCPAGSGRCSGESCHSQLPRWVEQRANTVAQCIATISILDKRLSIFFGGCCNGVSVAF
jgi:hypothetical protein